jgi:hypothetical protein
MPSYRLRGQEVSVQVVKDGALLADITDVKSFEVEFQLEIMSEGYVGEFTDRRDDIFKGISGKMELHIENGAPFDLINAIKDRAQRRTPGAQFNVQSTIRLANGQRKRLVINDLFFGAVPVTVASRTDYVTYSLTFEAGDGKFI